MGCAGPEVTLVLASVIAYLSTMRDKLASLVNYHTRVQDVSVIQSPKGSSEY